MWYVIKILTLCYLSLAALLGCQLQASITQLGQIEATGKTPVVIPDPLNNQVLGTLAQQNSLSWDLPDVSVTSFKVMISTTSSPSEYCGDAGGIVTSNVSTLLTGLTPNTTYFYRVCSVVGTATSKGVAGTFKTLKLISRAAAYNNFSNWNDYLNNDGVNIYSATQVACPGTLPVDFNSCINGGMIQKVVIPEVINCNRIKVSDGLSAFHWGCENSGSDTRIFSTELMAYKGLQDLIANNQFRDNYVLVKVDGVDAYSSPLETWWQNKIEDLPAAVAGATTTLTNGGEVAGKIFTVNSTRTTGRYSFTENKMSLVVMRGAQLKCDIANTTSCLETASGVNFTWFEGRYQGNGSIAQFTFMNGAHHRLHNIEMTDIGGLAAINLLNTYNLKVTDFFINNAGAAIYQIGSYRMSFVNGRFSNITGILFDTIRDSLIANAVFSGNTGTSQIRLPTNSIFHNNTFVNNSAQYVFRVFNGSDNLMHNVLSANSGQSSLYMWNSSRTTVSQYFSVGSSSSELLISTTAQPHKFTNNLILDATAECAITNDTGSSPGLAVGTCLAAGPLSDSNLVVTPIDQTKLFVGKVTTDDLLNPYDVSGLGIFADILDWLSFDNKFRFWGLDGGAFPSAGNKGNCVSGNCRIWDYSLQALNSNLAFNSTNLVTTKNDAFIPGATCPAAVHGNKATTWTDATPTVHTFLTNAYEVYGDGIGNEDGLCESNESCIYTPNFGAYQGTGDYQAQGTCNFQNGTISGVKLYAFPVNGI